MVYVDASCHDYIPGTVQRRDINAVFVFQSKGEGEGIGNAVVFPLFTPADQLFAYVAAKVSVRDPDAGDSRIKIIIAGLLF